MKIISVIILELENNELSLINPLAKIKALASRLNNVELLDWVNNEINGYQLMFKFPKYRMVDSEIKGVYKNNYQLFNNLPLFTSMLNPEDRMMQVKIGVEFMESLIRNGEMEIIRKPLISILCDTISEGYREMGYDMFEVISATQEIQKTELEKILITLRLNLLNLMKVIDVKYLEKELKDLRNSDFQNINQVISVNLNKW